MASLATMGNDLYTGKRSFDIVGRRRTWFVVAALLVLLSVGVLLVRGINPGIDFRGGSQFTVSGAETLDQSLATDAVTDAGGEPPRVAAVGSSSLRVQTAELSDEQTREVSAALAEAYDVPVDDVTATFVGPTWGADVTRQALTSLVIFLVAVSVVMVLYFRAWTFAAGAILALLHDVVLTVGIYAAIGFEVTPSTVIGFLTILGYSLYDTVVVFDKVRENTEGVLEQGRDTYAERSNLAVNQTLVRSINTSVTGLLPVAAILVIGVALLGAGTLRDIALALFVGMLLSTVSSVFIAAPAEVSLRMLDRDYRQHTEDVLLERDGTHPEVARDGDGSDDEATGADSGDDAGDGATVPATSGTTGRKRKKR
ncbi:protein translocase subunit SecF [Georgenia sp. Z1344]|uniref:protein translocase subunit SecF n=1 Tax=Georgenia sp. Z1344 TaxID=3416706 RepID=UPI003CF59A5F